MFSRFTASARRVMQRAFREAKRCEHDFVGTEHLLFGTLYDPEGPAVALLRTLGAGPELILEKVELSLARHDGGMAMEQFPLSPASRRVFRAAAEEAATFHHQMIGPEHLLLGVLRESDCEAAQLLTRHGVGLSAVRAAVARIPPDTYHEAQIRAEDRTRVTPSDNPSADELEEWIAPTLTLEQTMSEPAPDALVPAADDPAALLKQLRRTQLFLGTVMGYCYGHWLTGYWQAGIVLSLLGWSLAFYNKTWVSVLVCGLAGLVIAEGARRPVYLIALPLGMLFGTFLSDFWRFTRPPDSPADDSADPSER